jgi:opacity protein-like surface antigen
MKQILLACILVVSISAFASFNDYEPSVRARGMAGAYYTSSDEADAAFYNPAGLSLATNGLMVSHSYLFGNEFQELSTASMAMKLPRNYGMVSFGLEAMNVSYRDVNLTSEKTYSLSHGFTLLKDVHSSVHVGYSMNLYHLSFEGYGEQPAFGMNMGALAILHQRTRLGFAVTNLNKPKVGEENDLALPQKMAMGVSYIPYNGVITAVELKKTVDGETEVHAGSEVKVVEMLTLRCGARSEPASYSFGARFSMFEVMVDYAYNTHAVLGGTHHFGLGYTF